MSSAPTDRTRLLAALENIEEALADNVQRGIEISGRVQWFRAQLDVGATVTELVGSEETPRAVEMLTANMIALETAGSEFRANLAHALRQEGLTLEAIAGLYGVSRQRISVLLRQRADIGADRPRRAAGAGHRSGA